MSTATTRVPTKPGPIRRFLRWLQVRQLRGQIAGLQQTVKALEAGTEADRLELNRMARMGNKNLILRHRYDNEMQELFACREALERTRVELQRVECAQ